jgi:DMSO/TMAO reductase YedYZ molybdopterin-dependent catalytic subunit
MKKSISTLVLILLAMAILVACSSSAEAVSEPAEGGEVVLEIVGLDETKSLTMAELQSLEITEGWGGTKSSAGVITPAQQLKGVTIEALTELVGGLQLGMGVSVVAKDGYAMTMSYEQITQGDFITYDPGTGDEKDYQGQLQTIVAYQRDGEVISAEDDGPLRLFVVAEDSNQVVDGHWTVKWVSQIKLKPMSEEWSLYLEGALTEQMDRNSFESCSAPACHQAVWTDETGNEWEGVPLYYLAGRVDDGNPHEDRAYNDEFAKAGYALELFSADGYNLSIDSSRTHFNKAVFVASIMNGDPLEEKHFPLRLVGAGLEKSEMVGQLAQIVIHPNEGVQMPSGEPPAVEAEEPAEMVLPDGAALMVFGKVVNKLTLGIENLQAMNVVELEVEHPKKGMRTYQGIRLNDLLSLAGFQDGSTLLVITAADGFQAEASLDDVKACADCLIAFADDGSLSMAMPGMESNFWVKEVNFLEVK